MAANDYGTILPLCDVRGCGQPPEGGPVELRLEGEPECWIRVDVCASCRVRLHTTCRVRLPTPVWPRTLPEH